MSFNVDKYKAMHRKRNNHNHAYLVLNLKRDLRIAVEGSLPFNTQQHQQPKTQQNIGQHYKGDEKKEKGIILLNVCNSGLHITKEGLRRRQQSRSISCEEILKC